MPATVVGAIVGGRQHKRTLERGNDQRKNGDKFIFLMQ